MDGWNILTSSCRILVVIVYFGLASRVVEERGVDVCAYRMNGAPDYICGSGVARRWSQGALVSFDRGWGRCLKVGSAEGYCFCERKNDRRGSRSYRSCPGLRTSDLPGCCMHTNSQPPIKTSTILLSIPGLRYHKVWKAMKRTIRLESVSLKGVRP